MVEIILSIGVFLIVILISYLIISNNSLKKEIIKVNNELNNNKVSSETQLFGIKQDLFNFNESNKNELMKVGESAAKLDESKQTLVNLAEQMAGFQNILNDKKLRGIFGETQLYSIYEMTFGESGKFYSKQYKLSNGLIADSVVFGPKSLGTICIDSKFPLENFNRMNDSELSDEERQAAAKQFKQDVQFKINDIASKYIIPGETADFAFMFIAAESVYNEILANYQNLIELSYSKRVFITSPTNLIAYLSSIQALYLEIERSKNLEDVQKEIKKLSDEFNRFDDRREILVKDAERVVTDIKQLNTTAEKISKRFDSILSMELNNENNKAKE